MAGVYRFLSDLHLCPSRPATLAAFETLLANSCKEVEALYILGDLFEAWAGDDDAAEPFNQRVIDALAALSAAGVRVYFLPGNRDFLVGDEFAAHAGLTLLADPCVVAIDGQRILLSHGDALCTDDLAYQQFRAQVRQPAWRAGFLALPLAQRKHIIAGVRGESEQAKQGKSAQIMDVNPEAVAALFRQHPAPILIHGHTHRPALHTQRIDGHECQRWVLADWREDPDSGQVSAACLDYCAGEFAVREVHAERIRDASGVRS